MATLLTNQLSHCRQVSDGYPLRYRQWTPHAPRGTVLLLHGLISHSGWFEKLASVLLGSELAIIGADRRGSGLNQSARGDAPSAARLIADVIEMAESEVPRGPFFIAGWCWGAALAVNAALELGLRVDGLVLIAPGLFPSDEMRRCAKTRCSQEQADDLAYLPSGISPAMFSSSTEIQDFVATDPLAVQSFTARFFRMAAQLSTGAALGIRRLKMPVLLVLAETDRMVNNERTLREFRKLPADQLVVRTLPCDHSIQLERPQQVGEIFTAWLASAPVGLHGF